MRDNDIASNFDKAKKKRFRFSLPSLQVFPVIEPRHLHRKSLIKSKQDPAFKQGLESHSLISVKNFLGFGCNK